MKASEITFNSPDHKWIVEMMEELQSLWRVSEEAIGVNRSNYKSPTFIATLLPDLVKDSFGGFTFKLLREQWMKANLALANGERKDFQTLEWTMVRDAIRTAPLAVDESRLLAKPLTEAEQEAADLKAKWDAMTPEERIKNNISLMLNCQNENFDSVALRAGKETFVAMRDELTEDELTNVQANAWRDWLVWCRGKRLLIEDYTGDDRFEQSLVHAKKTLLKRADQDHQIAEGKQRSFGRRAIFNVYTSGQRKHYSPNMVDHAAE